MDLKGWVRLMNNIYRGTKDVQGIGDMKALETLDLSQNQLRRLPYGLGLCVSLKVLRIGTMSSSCSRIISCHIRRLFAFHLVLRTQIRIILVNMNACMYICMRGLFCQSIRLYPLM
jgi:hypothetical protein